MIVNLASRLPAAIGNSISLTHMTSLFELGIEAQQLTAAMARAAERLESDDPEEQQAAIAEMEAALLAEEDNKEALAAKADAYCWIINRLRGQAGYRQQQAKRLHELAGADAHRADRLEESLVLVLIKLRPGDTRFSFPNHELVSRKSTVPEIDDEKNLDPKWLTTTTTSKADKRAIKAALKAGEEIPGARLTERRTWRIK